MNEFSFVTWAFKGELGCFWEHSQTFSQLSEVLLYVGFSNKISTFCLSILKGRGTVCHSFWWKEYMQT